MDFEVENGAGNPQPIGEILAQIKKPLREPLTPPDCDLRSFTWMKLEILRLVKSETWILGSGDVCKALINLWCEAWHQVPAGSLPDDDALLEHYSGAGANWKRIREAVLKPWVKCSDGRIYHPTVAAAARDAWEQKQAQIERTKAARLARQQKKADVEQTEDTWRSGLQ